MYFVYDGINSQDMGINNVNMDSGLQSEPFYPSASILEISTRYNETPYFQKIKREPLVFNLTFAFEDGFDDDKLRETARWLNQKTFKELYFSNQPDKKYFAIYEGSPRLFHTSTDGYFEITFRTNSPYAHSDLIETGIYNQVSPALAFSRPSPAIHPETGAEVPADTPIFMTFAGDKKGLLMEDGTINKYTAARSRGLNPTITGGSIATVTPGQPDPFGGTNAVRIQASGGTTLYKAFFSPAYAPAEGVSVSGQMWVKNRSDTSLTVHSNLERRKADVLKSQSWIKIVWENIRGDGSTHPQHQLRAPTIDDSIDCDVAFLQYEEKPYCTSWQLGGVERANPTSLLTLPEALPDEFGIGIALKMLWGKDDAAGDAVWRLCFLASSQIDSNDRIGLRWHPTNKRWYASVRLAGITRHAYLPTTDFNAGDILGFYLERRTDRFRLASKFTGGEIVYTPWASDDRRLPGIKKVHIGGGPSANAILADFTLHDSGDIDPEGYLSRVPGGGST